MLRNAGTYQQQVEGYKAFIPSQLPITPQIEIDDELQVLLSKADRALGRLDGSIQALPNPELFVFMYIRKEAELSSQIEGTQASLRDVLKAEAEINDPERPDDAGEILNYVSAMNYGLDRLSELPISKRLIREIHSKLMAGVRGQHADPGEFRKSQNWIGPAGCDLNTARFVPPPAHALPDLLAGLEAYIHEGSDLPLLLKIGIVHAYFETLHPFLDGNGRVGRLLITFLLCANEVLITPVLYLSSFLKKHRSEYYQLLQSTRDEGDYESWLKFFLLGISEVANQATENSRQIVSLREEHREVIVQNFGQGAANGLKLLESLYQRPFFNVASARELLSLSSPAANSLCEKFIQLGLTVEITGNKRNRLFQYEPYLRIFTDID